MERQWLFDRCLEVQQNPDGFLDLWAREHYKSSIITCGLTIQDILNDPEQTFGIFSFTRPIAKGFLRQIMREFESNDFLKTMFPDILWKDPKKEAPKWSEDDGIVVKRKTNPKESTIEAWGLVDGQPTSKHFKTMLYDDIVSIGSVNTPEMIKKTTTAWELSTNLISTEGGKTRYAGTRYHFNDTYADMIRRGSAKVRLYPATVDGSVDGEPVLLTREALAKKRRDQGPYTYSCQMLLNPVADEAQGFKYEWFKFYEHGLSHSYMNTYILVDPANEKRKTSDYTSMWVLGLGPDGNYYILDMIRDRLNLKQRGDMLFYLHRKYSPKDVAYEKYGMQADVSYMREKMKTEHYHFDIKEIGGSLNKNDRIRRLIPLFEQGKVYFPQSCFKTNYEGKTEDLVEIFVEQEFKPFPVAHHDDMMDALSRICDLELVWPRQYQTKPKDAYSARSRYGDRSEPTHMSN